MTQLASARKNHSSPELLSIAKSERISPSLLRKRIVEGSVVIPLNKNRKISAPCGVGKGLRTKVNVNLGTSSDASDINAELAKLKVALEYHADTVMDLSVGGDLREVRRCVLKESTIPVGTVPIYEAAVNAQRATGSFVNMTKDKILDVIAGQAKDGVDFFTVHAGVTQESMSILKRHPRVLNIVSRGGAMLTSWMKHNKKENPLYEYFDDILDIAEEYDVTLSLGDSLRPGSILDATDALQLSELRLLGKLAQRARRHNVQVMIEGPGHVPLNDIEKNVYMEKKLCHGAPFYVLGPLVTDVAAGYDHISAAIGAALAARSGADFLCFLTPSEHLRHPTLEDMKEGLIAFRIAAHAADIAKGIPGSLEWDKAMSLARRQGDWERQFFLSIDPQKARALRRASEPQKAQACTMCSEYCSIRIMDECLTGTQTRE